MDLRAIVEETLVKPMREMRDRMTVTEEHNATNDVIAQMRKDVKEGFILHMAPSDVALALKRIDRLQMLAEAHREVSSKHETLVGDLLQLLNNDDMDGARDMVSAEYLAIHGPRE